MLYPRAAAEIVRVLTSSGAWKNVPWQPQPGTKISADFFGINVAGSPEAGAHDYIIERVQELGLKHVRMDLSYGDLESFQGVFLQRLISEKFRVMLRLVQPVDQAEGMGEEQSARDAWASFLAEVHAEVDADALEAIEIGAVPNRKKWSGYSHVGYLHAWEIAVEAFAGKRLAGPNVSDFEPLHTILLLKEMKRLGRTPDIHTVNLFVERVREPEAFDHRVMGPRMTHRLKLNLIKKAGIFTALSDRYGIPETMCTHTCWNAIRLTRWTKDVEAMRAAYLERYLVLAAASGRLDRVYWGPLIGHSDGLIDDGAGVIDPTERVGHYARSPGHVADYTTSPAFHTFRNTIARLSGSTFVSGDANPAGEFEFVFEKDGQEFRGCWKRDGDGEIANAIAWDSVAERVEKGESSG